MDILISTAVAFAAGFLFRPYAPATWAWIKEKWSAWRAKKNSPTS